MTVRPPDRSRFTARWPALRGLLRNAFRRAPSNGANGRLIHDYFRHKAQSQGYTLSHSQQRVIDCMAQQASLLFGASAQTPASLYLHGAVGRGKSWLLDGFFQALPTAQKQRVHFHAFFARLHQGMFEHREQDDALDVTLDELLHDCRVLCFDEFHVHDIGDAARDARVHLALARLGLGVGQGVGPVIGVKRRI